MSAKRLDSGGRIDRQRPLRFRFNGQGYQGFAGDSVFACQRHLIQCILEKRPSPISGCEYLRNLVIEEAIYESNHKGEKIEV
mgnify:CR=1 FL=1